MIEHFDADWRPQPDYNRDDPRHRFRPFGVTPGHGLEWSRLLLHAALDTPPDWLVDAARGLFARAVEDGWTDEGGFVYTGAAATLHAVTADEHYDAWCRRCWEFADRYLIDRTRGSWHHELDVALQPSHATWSGNPDVYHALQATLVARLPVRPSVAAALSAA